MEVYANRSVLINSPKVKIKMEADECSFSVSEMQLMNDLAYCDTLSLSYP